MLALMNSMVIKAAIEGGAKKIIFGGDRLQRKPYEISIYEQVAKL